MDPAVQLGLLLAVATAAGSVIGFLYKHRGAVESPTVDWRRPVGSTLSLFRSRWYLLGCVIATASWGLHVGALALAPISVVQTVIAGGLVLLTVVSDRLFGIRVTRREWLGVALCAAGLAFLAATFEGAADETHSAYEAATLVTFELLVVAGGAAAWRLSRAAERPGLALAASAGLLWGASDVAIKAASGHVGDPGTLLGLALVIVVLSLVALLISAASLQIGPVVAVIATTSVAANLSSIAAGPLVFGDPMPEGAVGVAFRLLAFAFVIAAAALIPGPVRVAETR